MVGSDLADPGYFRAELSWALKEDLDFNGKCRLGIGEEARKVERFVANGEKAIV